MHNIEPLQETSFQNYVNFPIIKKTQKMHDNTKLQNQLWKSRALFSNFSFKCIFLTFLENMVESMLGG